MIIASPSGHPPTLLWSCSFELWSAVCRNRSPKRPPRGPKSSPRDLQNAPKTILNDKKCIFQNSMNVSAKIKVFEVRRVILGVENRPQEAPRDDKKQLRRTLNKKMQPEGQQTGPKSRFIEPVGAPEPPKGPRSHDPRDIHRFSRLQDCPQRSPSHDLSALSTF